MAEIISSAESVKDLGAVGLLAIIAIVQGLVIRQLWRMLMDCQHKRIKDLKDSK